MAEGHIGSILGTLVCNAAVSAQPSVAHVAGDIYAICWDEASTDGYICTVNIPSNGINPTLIAGPLHVESTACIRPRIINMGSNIFAYAYEYALAHGIVRTIEIADNGTFPGGNIDLLEFEGVECHEVDICKIGANYAVVVYRDTNDDGKIATFSISDVGDIGAAVADSWVFDTAYVEWPAVLKIAATVFAFFFNDGADDGWVRTIGISGAGIITESIIDSLRFEASTAYYIRVGHFTGNVYAAVYEDALGHSWVTTMIIEAGGAIGAAYADRLNFNTGYGHKPTIVGVTLNVLAIAYVDSASSGEIYTFWCLSDGDITQAPRDTQAFDSAAAGFPRIFHITGGIFAVAYVGPNSYITLKTFHIETGGNPKHLPMMGMG